MSHEKWDDAMFWHGSLIGYMAGVKAACKDDDRLDLLLAMVKTQAKLEDVERENAKLREQMERLVTLLRVDCNIDASWDGLRRFWNIGLTEDGCLMRDRACKAEAENAKLRLAGEGE